MSKSIYFPCISCLSMWKMPFLCGYKQKGELSSRTAPLAYKIIMFYEKCCLLNATAVMSSGCNSIIVPFVLWGF